MESNFNSAFNLSAGSIDATLVIDPDPLSTKSSGESDLLYVCADCGKQSSGRIGRNSEAARELILKIEEVFGIQNRVHFEVELPVHEQGGEEDMVGRFVMAAYFQSDEEIREARMGADSAFVCCRISKRIERRLGLGLM